MDKIKYCIRITLNQDLKMESYESYSYEEVEYVFNKMKESFRKKGFALQDYTTDSPNRYIIQNYMVSKSRSSFWLQIASSKAPDYGCYR